ncbi:hypothetical protein B0J14DRAFT_576874 [Halenospora varia]|nr:hypothetical protein B0J14DRAFT_576874 [Halenospora varia]
MKKQSHSVASHRYGNRERNLAPSHPIGHNSLQDDIPSGTIASRIRSLTTHASSTPSQRPPKSDGSQRRENSRTGLGRRSNNRFGEPATRNTKPDEQTQIETHHSFLGLSTPRISHVERHAMADHQRNRTKFDRTPGIHGQIKPQGFLQRVQYDALSPWCPFPRQTPQQKSQEIYGFEDMSVLDEIDPLKKCAQYVAQTSLIPQHPEQHRFDTYLQRPTIRQEHSVGSETSVITTSSIRRQSVRDLYYDYGIERPARLVFSSEESHIIGDITDHVASSQQCHNCGWVNRGPCLKCWRCRHRFCEDCDALPTSPNREVLSKPGVPAATINESTVKRIYPPASTQGIKQPSLLIGFVPQRTVIWKPGPTTSRGRKNSCQSIKFPSFDPKVLPKKLSSITSLQHLFHPPQKDPPKTKAVRPLISISIMNSPFLVADRLALGETAEPVARESGTSKNHARRRLQHNASLKYADCDSAGCRATHDGHKPYRHSIKCTEKKKYLREETDKGYVADTSRVEDPAQTASQFSKSATSRSQSQNSHRSRRSASVKSGIKRSEALVRQSHQGYVECHGYPRTGHSLCGSGSPSYAGVIGECQHCLEDCCCAACQSTHHNVRCCVHEDHRAILHHHKSPPYQVAKTRNWGDSMTTVPKPSKTSAGIASIRKTSIATSCNVKVRQPSLAETQNSPELPLSSERISKKSSVDTALSLPNVKKSGFIKEAKKSPTPPPWVTLPQNFHKTMSDRVSQENKVRPYHQLLRHWSAIVPPLFIGRATIPPSIFAKADQVLPTLEEKQTYPQGQQNALTRKYSPPLIHPDSPSICIPSRTGSASSYVSKISSRRISSIIQLREKNAVPLLNQRLLEHQEELKRISRECDERIESIPGKDTEVDTEFTEQNGGNQKDEGGSATSSAGSQYGTEAKRGKRLKLKVSTPKSTPNSNPANVTTSENANSAQNTKTKLVITKNEAGANSESGEVITNTAIVADAVGGNSYSTYPYRQPNEHECIWKHLFLDEQSCKVAFDGVKEDSKRQSRSCTIGGVLGIGRGLKGVTVRIHLEGREDLILRGELGGMDVEIAGGGEEKLSVVGEALS